MNPSIEKEKFLHLDPQVFETYFSGVDRKTAINLYSKLARLFMKSLDQKITTLESSLEKNDITQSMLIAHQLKGTILSLGGSQIADSFRTIETDASISTSPALLELLKTRKPDLSDFIQELETWVQILQDSLNP